MEKTKKNWKSTTTKRRWIEEQKGIKENKGVYKSTKRRKRRKMLASHYLLSRLLSLEEVERNLDENKNR